MLRSTVMEAGEILREGYFGRKEVSFKGSVDLVTQYDRKIEEFLLERLSPLGLPVVAEESSDGNYPETAIFIDPIDGTTNFVHHLPFCAISVGIWKAGEAVEGVVYNPILGEMFYAKRGEGAFLNGEPIGVSETDRLIDSLIATGFPYAKVERGWEYRFVIEALERLLPITRDIRRFGSAALDLCYVACGRFDGFYEVGLQPWDTAAGILIVEEAGGRVTNSEGKKYRFGDIIVATNGKIGDNFIEALQKG
ncbi:MAG: inositol monophosphatase [Epsilonproteobacteria bacterium]|nr:inositol monophosphatase [Campylobacterota bacterium]NPA57589.1 inositol monophosphatase [Campylobacterota bacterium]